MTVKFAVILTDVSCHKDMAPLAKQSTELEPSLLLSFLQRFDHGFRSHSDAVRIGDLSPGDVAFGVDDKHRGSGDVSAIHARTDVPYAKRIHHGSIGVTENRIVEFGFPDDAQVLLR